MPFRTILVIAAAALAVAQGAAGGATAPLELQDPAGDAGCCLPDITSVRASSGPGTLSFEITFANRTAFESSDQIDVYIDPYPDQPGDGFTYALELGGDRTSLWVAGDDDWYKVPNVLFPVVAKFSGSTLTLSVAQEDVEVRGAYRFVVETVSLNDDKAFDDSPDDGNGIAHRIDGAALYLATTGNPSPPRAGSPWYVALDAHGGTKDGRVTCSAAIGARKLAAKADWFTITILVGANVTIERVRPRCTFVIPKNARGKRVTATISVTEFGVTLRRTFAMRVR